MFKYFPKISKVQDDAEKNNGHTSTKKRSYEACGEGKDEEKCLESPGKIHKGSDVTDYEPNIRERVRREYLLKGPCQPYKHKFKTTNFYNKQRRFNPSWFGKYNWLEYSISKDAEFCLYCYLFKDECGDQGGGDTFVLSGFTNWKRVEKLKDHVGRGPNSSHNIAVNRCRDLLNQAQHIKNNFVKATEEGKIDYRIRLESSIKCIRFLLSHGLPFRGSYESDSSENQGLFLELLQFLSANNEEVKRVILRNAPRNLKLTSPIIQKDIVRAAAYETTKAIIKELDGGLFSVLIDESRDISIKEQMAVVLRFVNKSGYVVERFLGLKHVKNTTAASLKEALDDLFSTHGLSISMLRGQGYDGASNMQGEYNGLKALIQNENKSAYYIHCFAHQLQLALVGVARKHTLVVGLFNLVLETVNVVGSSCKRLDTLRESQVKIITARLENEEIVSGRGLNQETSLARPGDTRWSSHYKTLNGLIVLFDSVVDVLDVIVEDGQHSDQKFEASRLLEAIQSFDFVIILHLMHSVLGITNKLSKALQRKDQDIENAMRLVTTSKRSLQKMRDDGWSSLLGLASNFCGKHGIHVPIMNDIYVARGRSRRKVQEVTNLHHYRFELFNTVIDMQLQELNNRFNETNTELLLCIACLNPIKSFASFNCEKLLQLPKFYPDDFSAFDVMELPNEVETFIMDVRSDIKFSDLTSMSDITRLVVESQRDVLYPLVYKLYSLALILPVATATVERAFSAMKYVKNRLRNKMGDQWLNDCLVVYTEKNIFSNLSDECILEYFQNMTDRRGQV